MNEHIKKLMVIAIKNGFEPFINHLGELVLNRKTNLYFNANGINSWEDVACKLLEWCSRDACKTRPFASDRESKKYNEQVRNIINKFLGTDFNEDDMGLIYSELGNRVNHQLTLDFINSGFKLKAFEEKINELENLGYIVNSYCYNVDTYCKNDTENDTETINIDYDDKQIWCGGSKGYLTFDEIKAVCKLIEETEEE